MIYIHKIEVAEISRERGIGKTLLNEMNQIYKRKDLMKLLRITNEANKTAIILYESLQGEATNDDDIK
tara:strand:- start:3 stop:206 length:204 start_codon:yes stop_codon:yes gene_type:complete